MLLDTRVVASSVGARLAPGQAVKSPRNPLLSDSNSERPWEVRYDNMQPNVYLDGSICKSWRRSPAPCRVCQCERTFDTIWG